jgi:tripartite-type tricarboxylate transporter receptor subunit TctC
MRTRSLLGTVVFAASMAAASTAAFALDYPSRPIQIVCPYAPGGGLDQVFRFVAGKMQEQAGQPIVFENKAGAAGVIATQQVINAKPDGYTALVGVTAPLTANPFAMKDARYDPLRDLTPVATIGEISFVLVVNPKLPIRSVAELTAHVRQRSGNLNYGTQSPITVALSEFYRSAVGFEATRINYKGMVDIASGINAGEVDFAFLDIGLAVAQSKAGRVRPLATTAMKRIAAMPELPTMTEAGFSDVTFAPTLGLWLPAGAPTEAVEKLAEWVKIATAASETQRFLGVLGADPLPGDAALLTARMRDETAKMQRLVKMSDYQPQ